jgi:hypothetical protein
MTDSPHIIRKPMPQGSWSPTPRTRRVKLPPDPRLNTLDGALAFARFYCEEIRQDTQSRRLYRSFAALANNQFEALLAFSIWKVRHLSFPTA